ncbi:MAG: TonB-dependent receptor [Gemmatimonadota bacterium]|nr:MAG: TonB-dependent receptor [Gemmatimonadota bacterium]
MSRISTCGLAACVVMTCGILLSDPALAQERQFDVSGVVADSAGKGIRGAMVVALTRPDSMLKKFATTGSSGAFTLTRLPPGEYILQVTFAGYQPVRRDFAVTDANVNAGTVSLTLAAVEIDALVVSAQHVPFVVKRDTIDYNIAAFPTRPNANVEDLLRRLPGIEVAADGTIKAQGEEVRNVLVEGKEFFGNDPRVATQNLPADAVERVQVYDRESDMAEFTGIADGEEERTINLQLKEEAKSGYFGRIHGGLGGGVGTETVVDPDAGRTARYDGEFSINRFSLTTQLAAVASANNINEGRNTGQGFTETLDLGLNASRDFGTDSWVRSSYTLNSQDNLQNSATQRQELLGSEVASILNQAASQTSDDLTHRLNLNTNVAFADGHDLRLRANLSQGSNSFGNEIFQQTLAATTGDTVNRAATNSTGESSVPGGSAQLTWRKRLSEGGRSVVAEARASLNKPEQVSNLNSIVETFDSSGAGMTRETLQEQSRDTKTLNHTLRISFIEPFGSRARLEVFGERSAIEGDETKSVYDIDSGSPIFNDLLSSSFTRNYTYLRGGSRFSHQTPARQFVVGLQFQSADINVNVVGEDPIANRYNRILPFANFRAQFEGQRSLNIDYRTATREPSVTELQPYVNNSNPLFVYVGNPDLSPEYTHFLRGEYRSFDMFSFTNLFVNLRFTYTKNNIVQSKTVNENARQVITSVNSDHAWSTTGGVNFGTPIRPIGAKVDLGYRITYSTAADFVNQDENVSRVLQNTVSVRLENRTKDLFDVRTGASLTFNNVTYSLNQDLNQKYLNSTVYADASYYLGYAWTFNASLNYRIYDQDVFAGQNVPLLRASISHTFLDERAEIELSGLDLLNQNQGVSIINSSSYIQERRTESLGRYAMLRFMYRLGRGRGPRGGFGRR